MIWNQTQVQLIVKISETGSFTKAGEELHITQPAVSRIVAAVENELGTKLINRNRKNGLVFTEVGERVLILFRNVLSEFQKVEELIAAEQGLEIGKIHVGAYPTACTRFIPKIIRTMEEKHPGLEVKLSEGSVAQVKEWLRTRSIDVGITIPPDHDLHVIPLVKDELIVVIHSNHPLVLKESIGIPDLDGENLILGRGGYDVQVHAIFKEFNLKPKVRFVVDHLDTALSMVREGLGSIVTTKGALSSLPEQVTFRELKPSMFRDINIAVPDMEDISKATDVFIQTARSLFSNNI
ncbi:LysR family transcriptional regulator [Paenibacillus sp. W2I17]|uniref:LysR family transcriptional regulator n=1 Tax=Paenibacillus sp. W2I17 TaxID=3042311 RepID=UPI0027870972|nr:LysR family transcriptional regulator [Paenibacillus sp. W2I17]MDQ0656153.1 DNA-binding transcriptional LysR family regulator [Paenibacillus sp. W2I17]